MMGDIGHVPRSAVVSFSGGRVDVYRRSVRPCVRSRARQETVCASVFVGESEVLRFDLCDPGHVHWAVDDAPRLPLPALSPSERVAWTAWQIEQLTPYAARLCGRGPVTHHDLVDVGRRLQGVLAWMFEL